MDSDCLFLTVKMPLLGVQEHLQAKKALSLTLGAGTDGPLTLNHCNARTALESRVPTWRCYGKGGAYRWVTRKPSAAQRKEWNRDQKVWRPCGGPKQRLVHRKRLLLNVSLEGEVGICQTMRMLTRKRGPGAHAAL